MRKCLKNQGFTLIELLVVIGIIVLLAGLLLPIAIKAIGAGESTRMRADLITIGTALDAYKQDNGRYPAVDVEATGFAVLGQALLGPGPARGADSEPAVNVTQSTALTDTGPGAVGRNGTALTNVYVAVTKNATVGNFGDGTNWKQFGQFVDGVNGYGAAKGADGRLTQDPYLAADSFNTNGSAILDYTGQPILYYPARAKKPNIFVAGGFVGPPTALWNSGNNIGLLTPTELTVLLGDLNADGAIGASEEAVAQGNFVLISPGADQKYLTVSATDDPEENKAALEETDDIVYGG